MKKLLIFVLFIFAFAIVISAQQPDITSAPTISQNFGMIYTLFGTFFAVALVLGLGLYIYMALALMEIAKRTNTKNGWFAWLPILNLILMAKIAKMSGATVLLMFVPIGNIIIFIIWWMKIAEARGKESWLGILMIIPIANLIIPGVLAWSGPKMSKEANPEIVNYIKQNKDKYPLAELRDALLKQGYPEREIDKALIVANK